MKSQEKEGLHLDEVVVLLEEVILHGAEEILVDQNDLSVVALVVAVVSAVVVESEVVSADVEEVNMEDIPVDMIDMKDHPGKVIEIGMVLVKEEVAAKTDMEVVNDSRDTEMKMVVAAIVEEEEEDVALAVEEEAEDEDPFQAGDR